MGFLNGKIYNGAFAGAQAWNQIKTEKGDLGGGLKKGNSVLQVYKRSARAPSHAASIAFPLCANYLICAVPNLQCYTSISLLGHDSVLKYAQYSCICADRVGSKQKQERSDSIPNQGVNTYSHM